MFSINSANQLIVVTSGSQYKGYIAVGTIPGYDVSYDWVPLEVSKDGTDDARPSLCCGMTNTGLLACDYGELFGDCFMHGVFQGPAIAVSQAYDYQAFACKNVTLSIVTS